MTGAYSLLHMSRLTRLTNVTLGYMEKDGGRFEDIGRFDDASTDISSTVNIAPGWPKSLCRLRAVDIGSWPWSKLKVSFSHLTNLTHFAYRPYAADFAGFDRFPSLPASPRVLELKFSGLDCMSSVIPYQVPGVTKLVLGKIYPSYVSKYGYARVFEGLKGLRHLKIKGEVCCFTAATVLEVLCWEALCPEQNIGGGVARLSCLTSLTDLSMTINCLDWHIVLDACKAVLELSGPLSMLARLELDDGHIRFSLDDGHIGFGESRVALCQCLAPLTAPKVWPQLQEVVLRRAWLVDYDYGAGAMAHLNAAVKVQNADAGGSDIGQHLLAQWRERRPQLVVTLQ